MHHPYQLTRVCRHESLGPEGLLLAACGDQIVSVKLADGSIVSQWPEKTETKVQDEEAPTGEEGPPGKKRRLESDQEVRPRVIKLELSPDHRHAVAVTDDKCVKVLEITGHGQLVELSERMMPKRPCSVLVTPDNQSILCGDKFGDVYCLPLIPASEPTEAETKEEAEPQKYVPTATNLTVHTGRNRRALENQLKQKELRAKPKESLKFEHKLLLGHVSMLTDVQFATQQVDGRTRGFIITADRDEHIRISRGPPNAYVIEGYCLGHKEYISKLCLLPGNDTLISGGGDDWLGYWDWQSGELRQKLDLRDPLTNLLSSKEDAVAGFGADSHVAVSGIWTVPVASDDDEKRQGGTAVLVASERLSALLVVRLDPTTASPADVSGVRLPGHPLDVAVVGRSIVVSFDASEEATSRLQAYNVERSEGGEVKLVPNEGLNTKLQAANDLATSAPERKQLDDLLYGVENLRKRDREEEAA